MAAPAIPSARTTRERRPSAVLLTSRTLWGGLGVVSMWLAVLFVGIFGGDLVSTSASGSTSVPAVLGIALFALLGTVALARHAFTAHGGGEELRIELENERRAREKLEMEVADLRARLPR